MRKSWFVMLGILLLGLAACQTQVSQCQFGTGTPRYLTAPLPETPAALAVRSPTPAALQIGGRTMFFDEVVEGPLCNHTWRGNVYVTCNVQVYPWEEEPLFLENCDLSIEPGTVVYVAYHNDTAYYKGCSCHTGEIENP